MSVVLVSLLCAHGPAGAGDAKARSVQRPWPAIEVLPDDTSTRGHWRGAYGSYVHVLPAMKGYSAVFGGRAWPIHFKLYTGNPKDKARTWRSPTDYSADPSPRHNPITGARIGGAFDDHGEAYALGKGPDVFIEMLLPPGGFLLSLYFFEIDWDPVSLV